MILYHGTSFKNLVSITNEGKIRPQGGSGSGIDYNEQEKFFVGRIFLTDDVNWALQYSKITSGYTFKDDEAYVVLEIGVDKKQLLPDLCDYPDGKSWRESLRESNQVCVMGCIESNKIKKVLFYSNVDDLECDTTFENWKENWKNYLTECEWIFR